MMVDEGNIDYIEVEISNIYVRQPYDLPSI
jgi:hypothetical protein